MMLRTGPLYTLGEGLALYGLESRCVCIHVDNAAKTIHSSHEILRSYLAPFVRYDELKPENVIFTVLPTLFAVFGRPKIWQSTSLWL